ncbi:hypothetical protein [uncultured Shewanella sp.]|uniref:hypothetical protein n=1 Tax=Shewanella atlantica TaxID=271099 RepID=UPI00261F8EF1|nr:hypothetical protein [uncultured Shewanella sp.]
MIDLLILTGAILTPSPAQEISLTHSIETPRATHSNYALVEANLIDSQPMDLLSLNTLIIEIDANLQAQLDQLLANEAPVHHNRGTLNVLAVSNQATTAW